MQILMVGDVVAGPGRRFLQKNLPGFKRFNGVDLCIVNGENAADGNGLTPAAVEELFAAGADVITTGNHVYRRAEVYDLLEREPYLVRPANFPAGNPGKGYCIVDKGAYLAAVVNLAGITGMDYANNPFDCIDAILQELTRQRVKVIVVDFHAEATSEKRAMGFYLDGKISVLAGTHTHVQTSDACVLPKGSGYITDLGMTGAVQTVLGVAPDIVIRKFKTNLPARFHTPDGECDMEGCLFDVDEKTGLCRSAQSVRIL